MAEYKLTFQNKKQVARGTFEFLFMKPEVFEYHAGQNMDWTLIDATENDAEGLLRTFSLTSAPHESYLAFATRMRDSAFKRQMAKFQKGDTLRAVGPNGDMTLQLLEGATPAVFVAGGIGITPFISMIKDAVQRGVSNNIVLFYSNHTKDDAPFYDEVAQNMQQLANGTFVPVMTQDKLFVGEKGYIDEAMIRRHVNDVTKPIYFVAGPPAMAEATKKLLFDMGVPRLHVVSEGFDGYEKDRKPLV